LKAGEGSSTSVTNRLFYSNAGGFEQMEDEVDEEMED
jgi:hypothetical protein